MGQAPLLLAGTGHGTGTGMSSSLEMGKVLCCCCSGCLCPLLLNIGCWDSNPGHEDGRAGAQAGIARADGQHWGNDRSVRPQAHGSKGRQGQVVGEAAGRVQHCAGPVAGIGCEHDQGCKG